MRKWKGNESYQDARLITVMFFGLSNSPATFQRFMNDSFKDMIAEGWLIAYMDDMLITATMKKKTSNKQEEFFKG